MNDQEVAALEAALEQAITWLNWLQKKYKKQTGQNFVLPLRAAGFADEHELEDETLQRR